MPGELVLVIGATGFIGFRTLVAVLEAGYRARAAVRRAEQITTLKATASLKPYLHALEFVVVSDILAAGAFDAALQDVTYVVHLASPLPSAKISSDWEAELIRPAVEGTLGIMRSATRTPSVKRMAITSSVVAIIAWDQFFSIESDRVFSAADETAAPTGPYGNPFEAYGASKVFALHAAEEFLRDNRPAYDVNFILPGFVVGRNELITDPAHILDGTNEGALLQVLGKTAPYPLPASTVHVDDVAKAHVLALDPSVLSGQKFGVTSNGIQGPKWDDSLAVVREHFPKQVADGTFPLGGTQPSKRVLFDSSRTTKVLGLEFKSYEDQVRSVAGHYLDLLGKAANGVAH